jgi:hypothetical protein
MLDLTYQKILLLLSKQKMNYSSVTNKVVEEFITSESSDSEFMVIQLVHYVNSILTV